MTVRICYVFKRYLHRKSSVTYPVTPAETLSKPQTIRWEAVNLCMYIHKQLSTAHEEGVPLKTWLSRTFGLSDIEAVLEHPEQYEVAAQAQSLSGT